jgi:hypothetical protein
LVGLEIDLVAMQALEFRPADRAYDCLHPLVAARAPVHGFLPRFLPPNRRREQKFPWGVLSQWFSGENVMQTAIDRVMHTYGMLVNLTLEQEREAREKVTIFLATAKTDDETKLAVEGLRYLRSSGER